MTRGETKLMGKARRLSWPGLVVGGLLTVNGCGEQKKIKECNALVGVINTGVDKIRNVTRSAPDGGAAVDELRALAKEMDGVAAETKEVALTLPELEKFSKEYQALAAELAAAARELATAVDNVDMETMAKAQGQMDGVVKREDPLIQSLNEFCREP
jgi:methyl-accepting chemotaxis protein